MYRKLLQIVCIVHVIFLLFITCTFLNERNDDIVDVNALDEEEDYYERNENVDYKPVSSSSYVKYVTKSLVLLGEMDEISGHILFFNRIPNCGSEMLILLIQWLEGWNNFRHVRLKSGKKKLSRLEQVNEYFANRLLLQLNLLHCYLTPIDVCSFKMFFITKVNVCDQKSIHY